MSYIKVKDRVRKYAHRIIECSLFHVDFLLMQRPIGNGECVYDLTITNMENKNQMIITTQTRKEAYKYFYQFSNPLEAQKHKLEEMMTK